MALTEDICAVLAAETGLTFGEVFEYVRRIRENGLFTRHTKSPKSWIVTDNDLAHLLAACMSGMSSKTAHMAVNRLRGAEIANGDFKHIEQLRETPGALEELSGPMKAFFSPVHSYIDGVAALFGKARQGPDAFAQCYRDTSVAIDQKRFTGFIDIDFELDPLRGPRFDVALEYGDDAFFRGDLTVIARVNASTIAAVARAAMRQPI